jgi:spoIIIJ-associated protein
MENSNEEKQSAEFRAKTVEDALRQATEHFGVPTYRLDYEIARDNTRSILGLVRTGEVVVRAWVRDVSAARPASVRPRPEPAAQEVRPTVREEAEETDVHEAVAAEAPQMEEIDEEEDESLDTVDLEEYDISEEEEEEDDEEEEEEEEDDEEPAIGMERNPPELEDQALDVLNTLLDNMGLLAAVEVVDEGGQRDAASQEVTPLVLNIVGDELGPLIGRRGETLRDLQFVLRLILSRRLGVWPNVVLDVEGYKAHRIESLRALARRMADQVRETGRMVVLEPMPAHERRIIHIALRGDQNVYTESSGEDERRKVQIIPKK